MADSNDPENIIEKVIPTLNLEESDVSIKSNFFIQIVGVAGMLVLYFYFRSKAPWVYYPNIKNKPQHPCYQENPGIFSWLFPLFSTKDTEMLTVIGLDGFMFLQTIKLLYRICFILSILIIPFLCGWFYSLKSEQMKMTVFVSLSIWKVKDPKVYWYILGISYLLTIFIFYLIFIYYKRFVTLRQIYLASPATMTSVATLKEISKELGDDKNAVEYINIASRTVLIDRLPSNICNDQELLNYIESLKLGEVESVSLIHDTYKLQKMYEERDVIIQDIEKEIAVALNRVKSYYSTDNIQCKESFGDLYIGDLEKSALSIFGKSSFKVDERVAMFNKFCKYADKFLTKTLIRRNYIDLHLSRLQDVNKRILEEKKRIENKAKHEIIDVPKASEELFVNSDVHNDVSFFSISQITNIPQTKELFSLDLPINKKKAFITFKDQRTAGIIQQTKLGSKAFSSNISNAPTPKDVMWRTLGKNEVTGFFFKLLSMAFYILFIFAFLYLVVKIIETLSWDSNNQNIILRFLLSNETIRNIYQSILVPLVYNILLYFVPITIKTLINMEDVNSFSEVQVKLMYRFSLFLFFNAFIATFVTSCVVQFTQDNNLTVPEIIHNLSSSVIKASVFFFNTIIQRMCIGSGVVFLKPSPFLYNFILARFVIYTRRQSKEREFSPPIDFGNHIPNLLLVLPMALVYSCICPIMLVVSWLFYFVSYFLYKNELLFATRNSFESGGSYWKPTVRFIFYTVITFQVVTAIVTYSNGVQSAFYFFLPLIFITFIVSEAINMIFDRSCENFPMNAPEEKFLDKFAKKTLEERFKLLNEWKELEIESEEDTLSIAELGYEDSKTILTDSFYKDPSLLTTLGEIIFPLNFFKIVHFLRSFDQKNLFGLRK